MAPPTLQTIAPELQQMVVDFLHPKADLSALCLTCKAMHAVALPKLCAFVQINLNSNPMLTLKSFFTADNQGHKYVRRLVFTPEEEELTNIEEARRIVKVALHLLPSHSLKGLFALQPSLFSDDMLLEVLNSQRNLQKLALGATTGRPLLETLNLPYCSAAALSKLEVFETPGYIRDIDLLRGFNGILKRARQLQSLYLCLEPDVETPFNTEMHDSDQGVGLLTKELFGHIAPFGDKEAMSLEALYLMGFGMSSASYGNAKVVKFEQLSRLSLRFCESAEVLLAHLSTEWAEKTPALKHFEFEGAQPTDGVLKSFIQAAPALTTLMLACQLDSDDRFDYACLGKHYGSLRVLGISMQRENTFALWETCALQPGILETFATKCVQLKELASPMPDVVLKPTMRYLSAEFNAALRTIARMPRLRCLRFTTLPRATPGTFSSGNDEPGITSSHIGSRHAKGWSAQLQDFASLVLRQLTFCNPEGVRENGMPQIRALGLQEAAPGCYAYEDGTEGHAPVKPAYFTPVVQIESYGGSRVVAKREKLAGDRLEKERIACFDGF